MSEFHKKWIAIWEEARIEYRQKAKRHADSSELRRCYVELALKQRSHILEVKASYL